MEVMDDGNDGNVLCRAKVVVINLRDGAEGYLGGYPYVEGE